MSVKDLLAVEFSRVEDSGRNVGKVQMDFATLVLLEIEDSEAVASAHIWGAKIELGSSGLPPLAWPLES